MEYTKTVWKDLPDTSTPITASRLNNIEDGVEYLFQNESKQGINEYSESTNDSYSCNYTNQIVESGNNENGNWIKYANGNLICYGSASIQSPTYSDWYGFCRATNDMTATLPTTFKDNDYKIIATSFTFGYFGMVTRTKNTNSFVFKGFTHNQSSYNPGAGTFDYIAIGKWK